MEKESFFSLRQIAYEQAIKGYQFHVQRYHTWVNYYAIFTGALFVAFYTTMPEAETFCFSCEPVCPLPSRLWMSFLILFLGWLASVCWLASIVGHYNWLLSWTRVLWQKERELFNTESKDTPSDIFVYRKVLIEKRNQTNPNNMLPGFVSTQKTTEIFVTLIILSWIVVAFFLGGYCRMGCYAFIAPTILLVLTCIVWICIFYRVSSWYSSGHLAIEEMDD